jgi:hypothetical protein
MCNNTCQAVLNRLEPGKISIRDTSKKRVAIVKLKLTNASVTLVAVDIVKYLLIEAKLMKKARFTYIQRRCDL